MTKFRIDDTDTPSMETGWTTISSHKLDEGMNDVQKQAIAAYSQAERVLTEFMQCEHLVVLSGLGTSLCIKAAAGGMLFPTMSKLWESVKTAVGTTTFDGIRTAVNYPEGENIEEFLSKCLMAIELGIASTYDIPDFVAKAENIIHDACRQVLDINATAVHEDFLRRLTRRPPRRPRPNLFTTNYDQCFETAAARIGLTVIDGFSFTVPSYFQPEMFDYDMVTSSSYSKEPDLIPRLLRLYKLHGSVDWDSVIQGAIEKKAEPENPVLIYPQSGKYAASYSPPFLELMSRFQSILRLRNVGVLVACCGFNDLHIAEPILAAVKSNSNLRLVVCAPDLCDIDAQKLYGDTTAKGSANGHPVTAQFSKLIDNGDNRLTLINGFFPDLVKLMPMLPLQTDSDQHGVRIKALESWVAQQKATGAGV